MSLALFIIDKDSWSFFYFLSLLKNYPLSDLSE